MFTQKHYVAIAALINKRRVLITTDPGVPMDASMAYGWKQESKVQLEAINEITNDFVKMFRVDNPKFKDLIFIEACCKDLRGE